MDMSKKVKIICDDIEYKLEMQDDKTILELALENDIDAPYSCRGGACATCIGKLKSGTVELEQNYILTDSEIEEGLIITCQAFPTSENIYVDADDI